MSERTDKERVLDALEAIDRIRAYTKEMDYGQFMKDLKTMDAVVRNVEILGEAAKNISEDLKKRFSHIPWKLISGIRDRLIHGYFGVNYDIVWTVVKEDLPRLNEELKKLLGGGMIE